MMSRRSGVALLFLLANAFAEEPETPSEPVEEVVAPTCRLWLAPSILSSDGAPRFGLFAGVDYDANDVLPNNEIVLPLIDVLNHGGDRDKKMIEFLDSIAWTGAYAGVQFEGNHTTTILTPGAGIFANYHTGTYNVDFVQASAILREHEMITEPGKPHPSRGAITPFYNLTVRATRPIRAGMELFMNHGDSWNKDNSDDFYYESLNRKDYEDADLVLDAVLAFFEKHEAQLSSEIQEDILDFMLHTILGSAAGKRANKIRSLIPENPRKLSKVKEMGGTFAYRHQDMVKSAEWLEEHGLCVDTLSSGKSTIPDAGRGAFATRSFAKGDIIAPVPFVPILSEELLEMYQIVEEFDENNKRSRKYDFNKPIGYQLIYNYAFGHYESNLLLIPAGSMVNLVNHKTYNDGANAYLTWSRHDHIVNDHRLHDRQVSSWALDDRYNIVMMLVAHTDIKEGDEIFIDYGPYWDAAWKEYKAKWETKYLDTEWPLKAEDLNLRYKNEPFPVDLKEGQNPYPDTVATACLLDVKEPDDGEPKKAEDGTSIMVWDAPKTYNDVIGEDTYLCDLLARQEVSEGEYVYTVKGKLKNRDSYVIVKNVPHWVIRIVDKPYTSDTFAPGVFRQWIGIEDQRFPQAWRNLRGD